MYQNKVTLIGFLGSNPEVRTANNRSFTTLSLATKSSYKKDDKYKASCAAGSTRARRRTRSSASGKFGSLRS